MTAARRIGLLGGSFDPPHLAHLALGRLARQALALDELRWLPAGAPWQKVGRLMAPAAHRAAMLGLLLADEPDALVDLRELQRDGATFTIDTLRQLQAEQLSADQLNVDPAQAEWFLILGQDQYSRFDTLRDWPELLRRCSLAVAGRAGQAPQAPAALAAVPHRLYRLDLPPQDIAASDIRTRLAAGQPVAALVGERIAGYISQHGLYKLGNLPETPRDTPH